MPTPKELKQIYPILAFIFAMVVMLVVRNMDASSLIKSDILNATLAAIGFFAIIFLMTVLKNME